MELDFDFELENSDLPFACPARVAGRAANRAGIVTLGGNADVRLNAQCDRCAEPFPYQAKVEFSHTLVRSRESEESDELILVENAKQWDPAQLIWEDIVLAMPPKMLCKPGCEGLPIQESGIRRQESGDNRLAEFLSSNI